MSSEGDNLLTLHPLGAVRADLAPSKRVAYGNSSHSSFPLTSGSSSFEEGSFDAPVTHSDSSISPQKVALL